MYINLNHMPNQGNISNKKTKKLTFEDYYKMGIKAAKNDVRLKKIDESKEKEGG